MRITQKFMISILVTLGTVVAVSMFCVYTSLKMTNNTMTLLTRLSCKYVAKLNQSNYFTDAGYFITNNGKSKYNSIINEYYDDILSEVSKYSDLSEGTFKSNVTYLRNNEYITKSSSTKSGVKVLANCNSESDLNKWKLSCVTPLQENMTFIDKAYYKYKLGSVIKSEMEANFSSDSANIIEGAGSATYNNVSVTVSDPYLIKLSSSSSNYITASIFGNTSSSNFKSRGKAIDYYIIAYDISAIVYWDFHTSAPYFRISHLKNTTANNWLSFDSKGHATISKLETKYNFTYTLTN
jgi:hypothetical protein